MQENTLARNKILYVITKGNFGGAQKYVYDLATSLASRQANLPKDKFEAIVACGITDNNLLKERLETEKIRVIDLKNSEREIDLKKDFRTTKDLIKIIKEEKPDIIHLNSSKIGLLGSFSVLFVKLTTKNYNLKSIFTSHGWAFNEQSRNLVEKLIFYAGHYLTVLFCDQTIAVSEKTKKDISWMPFIKNKVTVIYNGLSPFRKLSRHNASQVLKKEKGQIVIFTIAELHPNKGLDVALRSLSLLPENIKDQVQYYIAGDGEEKANLEKLIIELNLSSKVHLLGFIEEAKRLLSGADIFLFSSRTENLPFAVLEAGAAGLPIIATSVGGVPEIIKDMHNGILIHRNNPKEIAEAIMYLFEHKDKKKEFGIEIQKTVTNFFSLEKMLSETTSLYSKL